MSGAAAAIAVTVVWATPDRQDIVALTLPAGATVGEAVACSGLVERRGIDPGAVCTGVGGRRVRIDAVLRDGDRVEILRPLAVDPKEARRLRAASRNPRPADR